MPIAPKYNAAAALCDDGEPTLGFRAEASRNLERVGGFGKGHRLTPIPTASVKTASAENPGRRRRLRMALRRSSLRESILVTRVGADNVHRIASAADAGRPEAAPNLQFQSAI
jgi:hypothetical protein